MSISVNSIRDQIADLIGGDSNAQTLAVQFLNRAIDHLNMNGIVLVNRKEQTWTAANGDFTDGTTFIALPPDYGWPDDRVHVYDNKTEKNLISVAEFRPWENFRTTNNQLNPTSQARSVPEIVSIMAPYSDGKLYFWPPISTGNPGNVGTIVFPYFLKFSAVATNGVLPDTASEIAEALNCYGQFLMMQYRFKDKPPIWKPWEDYAELALRKAKNAQHRHELGQAGWHVSAIPDETGRLGQPNVFFPRGAVYILVSGV